MNTHEFTYSSPKKRNFANRPRVLGKILSTFWPPKVSHLRTECTWELVGNKKTNTTDHIINRISETSCRFLEMAKENI